jgi:3-phosphoshikimate 1-carboxyvinyltransferase
VTGGPRIAGVDLDLSAASELTPTLFALAAFADAPTTLHGIGHIRGHETDRIDALIGNLEALGGSARSSRRHPHRACPARRPVARAPRSPHRDGRRPHRLRVPGVEVDDIGPRRRPCRSSRPVERDAVRVCERLSRPVRGVQ